jgi:arylsulfatase A-like enzyme
MSIDVLPTIARLTGASLPEQKIDGLDIWPIFAGEANAQNPHPCYFHYYKQNELHAVRSGDWKLVFAHDSRTMKGQAPGKDGIPGKYRNEKVEPALYNLREDVSESKNVAVEHPEVVQQLEALAEGARADLGDALTKRAGAGNREPGRVAAP